MKKKEELDNILKSLNFKEEYFINEIKDCGRRFYCIAIRNSSYIFNEQHGTRIHGGGYMKTCTEYMTYKEMRQWFSAYQHGTQNSFSKKF